MLAGLKYQDKQTNISDTQLNESDKSKFSHSNFEPAFSIGYSQEEPLDLSFTPSVDPVPIHERTIQKATTNVLTIFDNALRFSGQSHFICDKCKEVSEYEYDLASHRCKFTREESNEVFEPTFTKKNKPKRRKTSQIRKQPDKCDEGLEIKAQENAPIQKSIHTNEWPSSDICGNSFSLVNHLLKHKKGYAVSSEDKQ